MKTLLLIIATTIATTLELNAQIIAANYFGGSNEDLNPMITESGGSYFVACATYSDNGTFPGQNNLGAIGIVILNASLDTMGARSYGGDEHDYPIDIIPNGTGGRHV